MAEPIEWGITAYKNRMQMERTRDLCNDIDTDSRIIVSIFKNGEINIFEKDLTGENEEESIDFVRLSFEELKDIYEKAKGYYEDNEVKM